MPTLCQGSFFALLLAGLQSATSFRSTLPSHRLLELRSPCRGAEITFPGKLTRWAGNLDDAEAFEERGDEEMLASLRKRLEELESKSPLPLSSEENEQQSELQTKDEEYRISSPSPRLVDPDDREKSIAWTTVKSIAAISASLSVGTLILYWLAGVFFVHVGPRAYPGLARSKQLSAEQVAPRSTMALDAEDGLSSFGAGRDVFRFEGFPDAVKPPDF